MGKMGQGKKPKVTLQVDPQKKPTVIPPESTDRQTPAWQFAKRDREHAEWGWDKVGSDAFCKLLHGHLSQIETMTWGEIQEAAGGRRDGNNSHFVEVKDCCKAARDRLEELKMDDVDQVFSLRLTAKLRLYGIREGRVMRFIWHDPDHTVYPTKKK